MKAQQMPKERLQSAVSVRRDSGSIIRFVADVRNRVRYQDPLTPLQPVDGSSEALPKAWNWRWDLFGSQFHGHGKAVDYQEGKSFQFVTSGGVASSFHYVAEPSVAGSRLLIDVELELPAKFAEHDDVQGLLTVARVRAQDSASRLKVLLESLSD